MVDTNGKGGSAHAKTKTHQLPFSSTSTDCVNWVVMATTCSYLFKAKVPCEQRQKSYCFPTQLFKIDLSCSTSLTRSETNPGPGPACISCINDQWFMHLCLANCYCISLILYPLLSCVSSVFHQKQVLDLQSNVGM